MTTNSPTTEPPIELDLLNWGNILQEYAADWSRHSKREFFSDDYFFMFLEVLNGHHTQTPPNKSTLAARVTEGAFPKRYNKVEKANDEGFFCYEQRGREVVVHPTDKLMKLMKGHLERTRELARNRLHPPG